MRRILLAASLLSLVVGVGCRHIAGSCDCYTTPDAEIAAGVGGQPYPVTGTPVTSNVVPEKLGMPEKAPGK